MISPKSVEIFCGTGGVGKTTLATSRALYLSDQGKKVLLITIDPAKRLKQILKLDEADAGDITPIDHKLFDRESCQIDALLMNPKKTLMRMASLNEEGWALNNPIIDILTRPYGGMNEIMAIIEVQHHLQSHSYDCIVLDTPPGKHFIDFLQSSQKIKQFFDKSFVDIFKFVGKKFTVKGEKEKSGFLSLIVEAGIKKLLKYLQKVTGEDFVEEFIDAISGLYRNRESFISALDFQEDLKKEALSNWFLVTSVEQRKVHEAMQLQKEAKGFMHNDSFLVINRSLTPFLEAWEPDPSPGGLSQLRNSMKERESAIKEISGLGYKSKLFFPEILGSEPLDHVKELAECWSKF